MRWTFVGAGNVVTGINPAPSVPGGTQAGDLLVIWAAGNNSSSYSAMSGWNELLRINTIAAACWWKIAVGTETTVQLTGGNNNDSAVILAYRGIDGIDVAGTASLGALTTNSLTTTAANDLVLSLYASNNGMAAPGGVTQRLNYNGNKSLLVCDENQASAAATTARTATGGNVYYVAFNVSFSQLQAAQFGATASSTASATASLTTGVRMAATAASAATATAAATTSIRLASSAATSAATGIAALATGVMLAAAVSGTASASLSQPLITAQPIASAVSSSASSTAALDTVTALAALSASSASSAVQDLTMGSFGALVQSTATSSAALDTRIDLAAGAASVAASAADLSIAQPIASAAYCSGTSTAGALSTGVQIYAAAGSAALSFADLATGIRFDASASCVALSACSIDLRSPLGSAAALSTGTSALGQPLYVAAGFWAQASSSAHSTASLVAPLSYARIIGAFDAGAARADVTTPVARAG